VIHDFGGSLTNNNYLHRYVLVGFWAGARPGYALVCGFAFSTSRDLISWTRPQVFATTDAPSGDRTRCPAHGEFSNSYYPSLMDPSDTTASFEYTGRTAYLFYVTGFGTSDRSLMRVAVRFDLPAAGLPDSSH